MKAYKKLSDDATGIMLNLYNECIEYDELNTIPIDDKTAKRLAVLRKDIFARLSVLIPNMWN